MAKINKKGLPPKVEKEAPKNLIKPASNELVDLNFKVSPEFKKEFQLYSISNDFKSFVSFFRTCFEHYKENH